jgi:hydroxymethylglutaryl-CoA lyase
MSASSTVWQGAGRRIHMQEVGTRDGLQMEQAFVPTEDKIALVNALSNAGLSKIEVTSFTSPTAIPALRDAEIVMREITRRQARCTPRWCPMCAVPSAPSRRAPTS